MHFGVCFQILLKPDKYRVVTILIEAGYYHIMLHVIIRCDGKLVRKNNIRIGKGLAYSMELMQNSCFFGFLLTPFYFT